MPLCGVLRRGGGGLWDAIPYGANNLRDLLAWKGLDWPDEFQSPMGLTTFATLPPGKRPQEGADESIFARGFHLSRG